MLTGPCVSGYSSLIVQVLLFCSVKLCCYLKSSYTSKEMPAYFLPFCINGESVIHWLMLSIGGSYLKHMNMVLERKWGFHICNWIHV